MSIVLELPAVWIDQVVLDDLGLAAGAPWFRVFNRNPEPNQIEVRADAPIVFDLGTSSADAPQASSTSVFVTVDGGSEVLAYDGAAFQTGWDGADSAIAAVDADTLRVTIDPVDDFESAQVITVRVVSTSTNGIELDESWTYGIEDLTVPGIVNAMATDKRTLLVTFDEPLEQSSASLAANFGVARLSVPAVNVEVQSVAIVNTNAVALTFDIEMTPGASYQLQVQNVKDLFDNAIPFGTRTFVGFTPAIPGGRSFDLWQMIPKINRDEDEGDLEAMIGVLQEPTDLMLCTIDEWVQIIDPDTAPEAFVDAMLCDLGNPFDFDLTLADKRRLIRVLVAIYKQKGTDPGIVNAVRFFLGLEVAVVPYNGEGWILGEDELGDSTNEGTAILGPSSSFAKFSFDVESPQALTDDQRFRIRVLGNYMKVGHTHFINIVEPLIPDVIDHLELGLSELGSDWLLH